MSDEPEPASPPSPGAARVCGCGHTIDHPAVVAEPRYSVIGTLTLIYGVTAKPKAIDFRCTRCGKTIYTARDERTIREHTT